MALRVHDVKLHKTAVPGVEAMTLVSNHHFPRHSHEQFSIGVIAFGAQRSWSGVGSVTAEGGRRDYGEPWRDTRRCTCRRQGAWVADDLSRSCQYGPRGKRRVCGPDRDRASCRARPIAGAAFRRTVCMPYGRPAGHACRRRESASLSNVLAAPAWHGATRAQWPIALRGKAIQRLNSVPDAHVSLAELAALSGVSRFQLLRGFAREVGITPHAYLVQRRVRLARRLLADGQTPAHAAILAGFADQSHMTRAFVRQLGVTPSRYRAAVA